LCVDGRDESIKANEQAVNNFSMFGHN